MYMCYNVYMKKTKTINKDVFIIFRTTPEEKAKLQKDADKAKVRLSDYIRILLGMQ